MSRQWAIVVRPDSTHVVRAIGPIKDQETAMRAVRRIEAEEDRINAEWDAIGYDPSVSWLPQAVELESVAEFIQELKDNHAEP